MMLRIIVAVVLLFPQFVLAFNTIDVTAHEDGSKTTGQDEIWHDVENNQSVESVARLYQDGAFQPLDTAGSTGLQPGAFWSHFALRNVTDQTISLDVEYVDHQLVGLDVFARVSGQGSSYQPIASMSLSDPFDERPVSHNRFVFQITIAPHDVAELLVKFSSHQAGFVFPSMRIWSPNQLRETHTAEASGFMFLFGGIFLMSVISLVGAVAMRDKTFLAYSVYALSKIVSWCTILGYTHQFIIRDNFHWNYLSISGSIGVLCGIVFARSFLQTRKYTPKLDYVFIFMLLNAVLMLVCAIFSLTGLAVLSITVALLLYPMMCIAGYVRWRQGSTDAAVFGWAWSLLVIGLVVQALRDLGLVEHSLMNYYWPAIASFVEMLGIMAAMGIRVRRLRLQKDNAELRYLEHLEHSKAELEEQVQERTQELQKAKMAAEKEARTDPLTGIYNRRSFFLEAGRRLHFALRKEQPLSLLMFDIDHFKTINDTFGHSLGDEALRQFCKTIESNLRDSDVLGRLGGEEFALVLCEDEAGTLQTAQRLRQAISRIAIDAPSGVLRLTASIGVVYLDDQPDIETLLNQADSALYQAKHEGRNRIVEYQADTMSNGPA